MAAMNTADIGFEKEIWKAADKMRGNIDASEYTIRRCTKKGGFIKSDIH